MSTTKLTNMSPQLLVADLSRSLEFYTQTLGFHVDFIYGDFYAGLSRDGHQIHLKTGRSTQAERENRRKNEHLDISFGVDGVADLHDDLKARQANIIRPLREMPYGNEFYIADPDGYILGFLGKKSASDTYSGL